MARQGVSAVAVFALAASVASGCGPQGSASDGSAVALAERAAGIAEQAAEVAEGAAQAAGQAAEAAEQLSNEAASILGAASYSDERDAIQLVTARVGNKVVFIPSTIIVPSGTGRKLSLYNGTEGPHGFQIPSLGVELIALPNEETEIVLPDLEPGALYDISCHLHTPHRHATLVVVPAR